jgi:SAM-dependent methyltransferase
MKNKFLFFTKPLGLYSYIRNILALAKARYYDKKIGIEAEESLCPKEDNSLYIDATRYSPSFYGRLERMVDYLKLGEKDVFVDLGCGKGRVVFFVALQKIKKVVGVEINKDLIAIAKDNLRKLKLNNSPVDLIHLDVVNFDVREGTVFFMFNPFGIKTLEKVISNIKDSLITNPRKIRIVYYCPAYCNFLDKENWLIREGEIENKNCLVWRSR